MNLHSTLLSLDNNDNVDGKFIAEFDIIKAMIGVDEKLLMDSLNYIDENCSKESAIYIFVKED